MADDFQKYLDQQLKDPAFKAEFDAWELPAELSKRLQEERVRLGLTQSQLAKKLGVKQQDVSKVETLSGGIPRLTTIGRIAHALGMRIDFQVVPQSAPKNNCAVCLDSSHQLILQKFDRLESLVREIRQAQPVLQTQQTPPSFGDIGEIYSHQQMSTTAFNRYPTIHRKYNADFESDYQLAVNE